MATEDESIVAWLAANLRRIRRRRGLTQEQLAQKLAMESVRYVQRVEAGTVNITIAMLAKLARVLEVRPGDLIRRAAMTERPPGKPTKKKRTARTRQRK